MQLDITTEQQNINFAPKSTMEEVAQNVRMILTTLKKTVPMDREFGVDGELIDLPVAAAQARMTAEIVDAVHRYEPRARVVSVGYEGSEQEGELQAKVRIEIDGT